MEDTAREDRKIVYDVVMSKTVEDRFLMCAQLYEDAKEFAKIGMPAGLSQEERETFVFERIHGARPEQLV